MDNPDLKKETREDKNKKSKNASVRWSIKILVASFALSIVFNAMSETALQKVSVVPAFLILGMFILLGIIFDIFGVATTTSSEKTFHAMASKRVSGSHQALWLVKNAEKVSSFCNDVVGDICGIMSGSTASIIVAGLPLRGTSAFFVSLVVCGFVAGITVGGKAFGKSFAMTYNDKIVFFMARVINVFSKKS
ncbi:MAG: hypothetical protein IKU65_05825 [Oscillospiraceae bacterium]|nr:hypothetical protein [Oscillospiraceae bacterium]